MLDVRSDIVERPEYICSSPRRHIYASWKIPHRSITRSNVSGIQPRRHTKLCRQCTQGQACEIHCRWVNTAIDSSLHALNTRRSAQEWKSGLPDTFCPTDSRNRARPLSAVPSTSHNLQPQSRNHSKLLRWIPKFPAPPDQIREASGNLLLLSTDELPCRSGYGMALLLM